MTPPEKRIDMDLIKELAMLFLPKIDVDHPPKQHNYRKNSQYLTHNLVQIQKTGEQNYAVIHDGIKEIMPRTLYDVTLFCWHDTIREGEWILVSADTPGATGILVVLSYRCPSDPGDLYFLKCVYAGSLT